MSFGIRGGVFFCGKISTRRTIMTIAQMRAKQAGFIDSASAITTKATADGRDLTAEESAEITSLLAQAATLGEQITAAEQSQTLMAQVQSASASLDIPAPARSIVPGVIDAHAELAQAATRTAAGTTAGAWEADPMCGFRNEGHLLMEVLGVGRAGHFGAAGDNVKALFRDPDGVCPLAIDGDGQHTYSDPDGGFLVPEAMLGGLMSITPEMDPSASRVRQVPMTAVTVKVNARVDSNHQDSVSGGLRVYRRAEEAQIKSSKMKFRQIKLEAESLFGLAYMTEEQLRDSAISMVSLIGSGFNDEFAAKMFDERLNGTGVGEFIGVHVAPSTVVTPKEGGQAANTLNYDNLLNMRARAWRYSGAIWQANHDVLPTLSKITDPEGHHIFQLSLRDDVPDMLLGRPLVYTEFNETLGDKGDIGIYNWGEYLNGTYQPLEQAESIHVRFDTHERAFKFWMRNDGAPWWEVPLTPKKGANTLSPFVILEARD